MRLSVTVLFCVFTTTAFTAHARTWEFRNGTRIDGKFVRLEGNDVRLRVGRDAKLFPFSGFSVTDQEFIRYFHMLRKLERDKRREEIYKHPERVWTLKNGQQGTGRFLRFFRAELPNGAVVPHVTILPIQSFPYAALLQKDQAYVRHVLEEMGIAELLEPGPRKADRNDAESGKLPPPSPRSSEKFEGHDDQFDQAPSGDANSGPGSLEDTVAPPPTTTPVTTSGRTSQKKTRNSLTDDIMEGNWQELPGNHGGQLALIVVVVVGALVLLKVLRG